MPRDPPTFLTLPLEVRLEIYSHLLVLPPPPPRDSLRAVYRCSFAASRALGSPTGTSSKPTLHPQILRVNKQTYHEALPILYGQNTFSAHPVQFTARPTLYHPYCSPCRPVTTVTPVGVGYDPKSSSSTFAPGVEGRKEGEKEAGRGKRTALALTNPNIRLIRKWHLRVRLDGPGSPAPGVPAAATPSHSPEEEQGGDDASTASMSLPSAATVTATATAIATGDNTIPTSSNRSKPATQPEGPPGRPYPNPIAAAFSNAESLTLDLWRGGSTTSGHGAAATAATAAATGGGGDDDDEGGREEAGGPAALRPFEDVRGVRRVRIVGATAGIEGYLGWLQERMTVPTTTATKGSG
ncbi:uncharacterized protein P884DRAFT_268417 [Thermothelomyces heterothallicus CBS 202.75]|uniref:uncharacterized protein n=1 Tax=Thermothelomyces heterothallicus CBS 202.75 TaxID=1149848 RepID=UPI003742A3D9